MKRGFPAGTPTAKGTSLRKAAFLLVLCMLVLTAASCTPGRRTSTATTASSHLSGGTTQKTGQARQPLAMRAYRATTGEGSTRVAIEETEFGLPPLPNKGTHGSKMIRIRGFGLVSFTRDRARVRLSTPGAGHAELRQLGYTIYEKSPSQGQEPRSHWVRLNLLALAGGRGAYLAQLASGQLNDPVHQLDYLEGVIPGGTRKFGRQEVRGVPTTRYHMVVDLDRMSRENPRAGELYEALMRELGSRRLPVTVWLDGRDRVRRFESTVPIEIPRTKPGERAGSERGHIRISLEYYDFGIPARVKAPPVGETTRVRIPPSR